MFQLTKLRPQIYSLTFDEKKDLIYHFMRWQEIYESAGENFRNKPFQLIDYIKWYSFQHGTGNFDYYSHWAGFNIPGDIIKDFYPLITDKNDHDNFMFQIYNYCTRDAGTDKIYLIGSRSGESVTLRHEVAHGLFYTNEQYKLESLHLVSQLPQDIYDKLEAELFYFGYCNEVINDEIQAFMATGLGKRFGEIDTKYQKPFIDLFNKYNKE